jgi:arylsulfatase A-like enzyme
MVKIGRAEFNSCMNKPLAFLLTLCLSWVAAAAPGSARPPNIIVILTDDQGWADLSCQGSTKDVRTPHLDRLAAGGVRCTAGYITAPQCSPSRAGLITGRYQQRFGFDTIPDCPLPLEEQTIAEMLPPAYVSGAVGKWHLDPNHTSAKWIAENLTAAERAVKPTPIPDRWLRAYSPLGQGFRECFSGEMQGYLATFDLKGNELARSGERVRTNAYRLETQTAAAVQFIRRQREQPFFLYLGYFGPHVPLEAPPRYLQRFPGDMPERRRYALAMLSAIDDGVGRILDTLQELKLEQETLLFYTSDNGAPLMLTKPDALPITENGWDGSLNDPFRGEKGMLSEGGIRVPFLVRWPGKVPAGKVFDLPVSSLDMAATALAAAGMKIPGHLDGVDLRPYLDGTKTGRPHEDLYWRFWNQAAVRSGDWKYIKAGPNKEFLFDLQADPTESRNLAASEPVRKRELVSRLEAWTKQVRPPGMPKQALNVQEQRWFGHYFKD